MNYNNSNSFLLQPLRLGNLELKNRLFIPSHSYGFSNEDGIPGVQMIDYVLERAKGGAALLILGETMVTHKYIGELDGASLSTDKIIPFYKELCSRIKPYNMAVFDQLFHPGGQVWLDDGAVAVAPSPIAQSISQLIPQEISIKQMKEIIAAFSAAAYRAKEGGLQGIEIKADQGKLHHQFLSQYYNRRTDYYGGEFSNRVKFLIETLQAIRDTIGPNMVLGVRLCGDSLQNFDKEYPDIDLDEAVKIAKALDETNLIDYLSISGATNSNFTGYWISHGDSTVPKNNFAYMAKAIKQEVKVPIFTASQILDPLDAAFLVKEKFADAIGMVRAHIAEPFLTKKIIENRISDIRPCISCNQSCVGNTYFGRHVQCIHNVAAGRELELGVDTIKPSINPKMIAIIGGGPAGLEAARVAAECGHKIVLFEKSNRLGGQLQIAALAKHKHRFLEISQYLTSQLQKYKNVEIKLGTEVQPDDKVLDEFDLIIVAIGSEPVIPTIRGITRTNSFSVMQVLESTPFKAGDRVIVIDIDWRLNALSVAENLLDIGVEVIVVTPHLYAGQGLDIVTLTSYRSRLGAKKVEIITSVELSHIEADQVFLRNIFSGDFIAKNNISAVVFGNNHLPRAKFIEQLKHKYDNIIPVGDCVFPRGIQYAMLEGNRAARFF